MTKILEVLRENDYNNGQIKKKTKTVEKSRDFFGVYPGTKRVVPFVSEEEYREVCEAHKE